MKKSNKSGIGFKYIYVDGDRVRVRVPGKRSKSFTAQQYGSEQRALEVALSHRDAIIS